MKQKSLFAIAFTVFILLFTSCNALWTVKPQASISFSISGDVVKHAKEQSQSLVRSVNSVATINSDITIATVSLHNEETDAEIVSKRIALTEDEESRVDFTNLDIIGLSVYASILLETDGLFSSGRSDAKEMIAGNNFLHISNMLEIRIGNPVITPDGGVYPEGPLDITIETSSEEAILYYTLDGSDPTINSQEYKGPIQITVGETDVIVNAIAIQDDIITSQIVTETYTMQGTVETPVFLTKGGSFPAGQKEVFLINKTDGALIYYTLDGSTPSAQNTLYDELSGITIEISEQEVVITAIGIKEGMKDSAIASEKYTLQGNVITPDVMYNDKNITEFYNGIDYSEGLTFVNNTEDATIFYKWSTQSDFEEWDENKNTGPIPEEATSVTVKATKTGMKDSGEYTVPIRKVQIGLTQFIPSATTIDFSEEIVFKSDIEDVTFHYTLDDSEPTKSSPSSNDSISILGKASPITIKVLAEKTGCIDSDIAEITYAMDKAQKPTILYDKGELQEGSQLDFSKKFTFTSNYDDVQFAYAWDEDSNFTELAEGVSELDIEGGKTSITVKAFKKDGLVESETTKVTFSQLKVVKPEIKVGALNEGKKTVTIESETDDVEIYYTISSATVDGGEPTESSTPYDADKGFNVDASTAVTLRVIAFKEGYIGSDIVELGISAANQVEMPIITISPVDKDGNVELTMTSATNGASILYTDSDGVPITPYDSANKPTVNLSTGKTIKAIATTTDPDMLDSGVAEIELGQVLPTPTFTIDSVEVNTDSVVDFSKYLDFYSEIAGLDFYYTTDGTNPTKTSSKASSISLAGLNSGATIKVMAVADGRTNSFITSVSLTKMIDYYVSATNSNDGNTGTQDSPLLTVQEAVNRILSVNKGENYTIQVSGTTFGTGTNAVDITSSKTLNITIQGNGVGYIDGQDTRRVFNVSGTNVTVTLGNNLTIQNGKTSNSTDGGGILISGGAEVILDGATIGSTTAANGNFADRDGGGVGVTGSGSVFTMKNGYIRNNSADSGGGIVVREGAEMHMSGGEIGGASNYANKATLGGWGGGGIYVSDSAIFTMGSGTISYNTAATFGGGIFARVSSSVTLSGSAKIQHNESGTDGGGVYIGSDSDFEMNSANALISNNSAKWGGGLYLHYANAVATITNGTISQNTANGDTGNNVAPYGAGVFINDGGKLIMSGGSITSNAMASGDGAGVLVDEGTLELSGNAIIENNTSNGEASNVKKRHADGKIYITAALNEAANIGITPYSTTTNAILVEGKDNYDIKTTDADDIFRDDGGVFAIVSGDLRIPNTYYVSTSGSDSNTGVSSIQAFESVQKAVDVIVSQVGDAGNSEMHTIIINGEITRHGTGITQGSNGVDDGMVEVEVETDKEVHITLRGVGAQTPGIINEANDHQRRVLNIRGENIHVTIGSYLTLKGGTVTAGTGIPYSGGGVLVQGGATFTLDGGTISNNAAYYGAGIYAGTGCTVNILSGEMHTNNTEGNADCGGAIYINNATLTMDGASTNIRNNTSQDGAGVYISGSSATFAMKNGTIYSNTADTGGGIFIHNGADVVMSGGTIGGSSGKANKSINASWGGGGVFVRDTGSTFTMTNGTISYNTASKNGGGVYGYEGGSVKLSGSTAVIEHNTALNDGGGISVMNAGAVFTMEKGIIRSNTANAGGGLSIGGGATATMSAGTIGGSAENANKAIVNGYGGGGVYVNHTDSSLTMTGGTISHNTGSTHGGGVYLRDYGKLYLKDSPIIINNTVGGASNNVRQHSLADKVYITGALEDSANVGIRPPDGESIGNIIAEGHNYSLVENDMYAFVNDRDNNEGFKVFDGNLILSNTYDIGDVGPGGGLIYSKSGTTYKETSYYMPFDDTPKYDKNTVVSAAEAYNGGGNSGWSLPSQTEIEFIYDVLKSTVLAGDGLHYFTTTTSANARYVFQFGSRKGYYASDYVPHSMRAIRTFTSP